jgi:signal transduction histidine kinase
VRIRSRLLLLVSAVVLPALAAAAIVLGYSYREAQEFNRSSMRETARALALALDRDMARREAVLGTLAQSPALAAGDLERFYAYALAIARETNTAIILSDLEGRQIANTRLPLRARLPPMLPEERENRRRLGNEVSIISDLYVPPAGLGPHSFAIQIPVRRGGQVVQFLTMASFASEMQKLVAEQRLPAGWHGTILDRRGFVAARSVEPEKFVGQRVRDGLAAKIAGQPEGFHEGQTLAGVASTAFFSRAPASGWVFLLAVPHSALYGAANRAVILLAAVSLLLIGLGVAAALGVGRRIARPVESLREAAERLGHQQPVGVSPSGTPELDAVALAMAGASERLRGANAELERRVTDALRSFEQSQRALMQAQKLEALGRLTGGIAHDFNNVLQTLSTGLETLKLCPPQEQAEMVARCQRAVERGTELARQLMAFGRVQEARNETIDTAARLAEARHLLGGALPANVTLEYDIAAELWPVTVDPAQFELALLNLVINARDAMSGGGPITLTATNETLAADEGLHAGDYVVISLSDSGEGMSDEVVARALDPFFTTKGVGKGSGMGLPQAYGFARQSGGTLRLESRKGFGTTVRICLPRASVQPAGAAAPPPEGRVPKGKGKVLLVEDDAEVRETMSAALRAAGFEISTAFTADEARQRIDGGEGFDAVLSDVVMPGSLSGIDLAHHLRKHHPRTGVVIVTGYSDRAVQLPGVRALAKPYDLRQAVEAINAALAAS